MPGLLLKYILPTVFFLTFFAFNSEAQFKEDAFSQTYNNQADSTSKNDSSAMFKVKRYFTGLGHKNTLKIGTMFAGSVVLPGTAQIYNKDYWKLPIVYGGVGALAGTGGYYLNRYNKTQNPKDKTTGTWLLVGAGVVYWGSLLDGVVSYQSDKEPLPGRATLYSALLPGLGQIYNGEFFKIPIYWGGLAAAGHFWYTNDLNYRRFKRIHNEATDPNSGYDENISAETAKWYRDEYRRYRDYSIVATALVYLLQVIDANVFAYMHDFEVNDDITMNIEPALISPYDNYALHTPTTPGMNQNAVGMKIGFTF